MIIVILYSRYLPFPRFIMSRTTSANTMDMFNEDRLLSLTSINDEPLSSNNFVKHMYCKDKVRGGGKYADKSISAFKTYYKKYCDFAKIINIYKYQTENELMESLDNWIYSSDDKYKSVYKKTVPHITSFIKSVLELDSDTDADSNVCVCPKKKSNDADAVSHSFELATNIIDSKLYDFKTELFVEIEELKKSIKKNIVRVNDIKNQQTQMAEEINELISEVRAKEHDEDDEEDDEEEQEQEDEDEDYEYVVEEELNDIRNDVEEIKEDLLNIKNDIKQIKMNMNKNQRKQTKINKNISAVLFALCIAVIICFMFILLIVLHLNCRL